MIPFLLLIIIAIGCYFFFTKKTKLAQNSEVLTVDEYYLEKNVNFYSKLDQGDKVKFRDTMGIFLREVKISAAGTTITNEDKILVAAGAVIPIFRFPNWHYLNLKEVIIYGDNFNHNFESKGAAERQIMGMVGAGYMEGTMLLSKPALENGFENKTDKENTVIHEFVHLIDKLDGDTDGIPKILLQEQSVLPWVNLIHLEMKRIEEGKSDINPYGYTNQAEFFAVVAEYFFERPDLLKTKHPVLFEQLNKIFHIEDE